MNRRDFMKTTALASAVTAFGTRPLSAAVRANDRMQVGFIGCGARAHELMAAAVAMPDENLGERTCIYVVPKPGEAVTLEEIKAFMTEKGIAAYKIPERVEIVEAIPRNPVGKILKKVLREDIKKKLSVH